MTATTLSHPIDTATLDARPMPTWYRDAKLGIFVHWGLYSIPAFAERTEGDFTTFMRDLTSMKDTHGAVPYAEWYLNALRIPGSATAEYHKRTFGPGFSYFDLRRRFALDAAKVDLDDWASFFADVGARYVVLVTRHLDGYPLWPTRVANPHMPEDYRSERDLVGDLTEAVRARGMRMGLYYAGGVDWTFTDHPIRTMIDLMADQALGPLYAHYAEAQVRELVERYEPSILWNDMGWPEESDPNEVIAGYYGVVHDGLVNDRWTQAKVPGGRLARQLYLDAIGAMLRLMAATGRIHPDAGPVLPLRHRDPRVRRTRVTDHGHLGADTRPGPLLRLQRTGDCCRRHDRQGSCPPARGCREQGREPADQCRAEWRGADSGPATATARRPGRLARRQLGGDLRDPPVVVLRDHDG